MINKQSWRTKWKNLKFYHINYLIFIHIIRLIIIFRIGERSFLHDSVLTANGIENEDSTCVELDIHATFNTKLEALEYLSNGDISVQDFIILERYKLVKLKEDK